MKIGFLEAGMMAVIGVGVSVLISQKLNEPEPLTFWVIDAPQLTKIFTEKRLHSVEMENLPEAIFAFDQLVTQVADEVYAETGKPIVNKAHLLAGGDDVTAQFADRVIATWDQYK